MDEPEDKVLVRQCLEGDPRAFETLLERYEKAIFNAVFRILRDYEDARDVTQSVCVKVYQNLESYDARFKFFSWLYRSAINESLNLLKGRRRFGRIGIHLVAKNRGADQIVYEGELSLSIQDALMELKPDQRVAIVLKHFSNCSYRDMSEIFGIPEKTVKSRLFEARKLLREILIRKKVL